MRYRFNSASGQCAHFHEQSSRGHGIPLLGEEEKSSMHRSSAFGGVSHLLTVACGPATFGFAGALRCRSRLEWRRWEWSIQASVQRSCPDRRVCLRIEDVKE